METLSVEAPIPTVSSPVPTAYSTDSQEPSNILGVTSNSDESNGVEADISNMETTITDSPTPTPRIHKHHPKSQIIGHVDTPIQTKNKSKQKEDGIFLSQDKYVGDILKKFGYIDVRSSNNPMDKENPWGKDGTRKDVDLHLYRSMIGSLMYLTASRPDIMFAVCAYARHQVTPTECHLHAIKRIFRYLKGHPKLGLWYPKESPFDLVAYSDSDYGGATQDRKSTTEGCQFLGRRDCFEKKLINVDHIHSDENVADLLTKPFDAVSLRLIPLVSKGYVTEKASHELASPHKDVSQGEACPTDFGFIADQDRATIAKSSTFPMSQHQGSSIGNHRIKSKSQVLGGQTRRSINLSGDDAPIKGRRLDEEEVATEKVSSDTEEIRLDKEEVAVEKVRDDTEEMATVLITMDATSVLSSGGVQVVPSDAAVAPANVSISTGSGVVPTASTTISTATPIFATDTTVTPYTRRKGKEKIVETHTSKKKKKRLQEQIDIQFSRELEEKLEREAQRMNAQIARDKEIAKIHAEEELQQMIEGLDRSNETIAKHLEEYEQAAAELTIGERIGLISELVKYQDHHSKILQYQAQQRKTRTKKQKRDFYMESAKKQKTSEEVPEEVKSSNEVPEEKIKELIQLVPIKEVYVEAFQVKHLIINWKVHTEGQRNYGKITRLGGSSTSHQFFVDMLKQIDREDLNQLWALVKETLSVRPTTNEKEMELSDLEIFMLVEKNYPLRKVLALVMIYYKLQVENYSQMATDLVRKIQQIAGTLSLQVKKDATARRKEKPLPGRSHCYQSGPKHKPVNRKTSSKRRVKKKVTLSVDDKIISDDPDTALELGKSISKTKVEEAEATRQVHATHARIVTKFVLEPTKIRKSGKVTSNPPKKLKGVPSLTLEEQEAANIMQALKKVRIQTRDSRVLEAQVKELVLYHGFLMSPQSSLLPQVKELNKKLNTRKKINLMMKRKMINKDEEMINDDKVDKEQIEWLSTDEEEVMEDDDRSIDLDETDDEDEKDDAAMADAEKTEEVKGADKQAGIKVANVDQAKDTSAQDNQATALVFIISSFSMGHKPDWGLLTVKYATMMRQNKHLMDINIDALYNILKQNHRDVNDAMGSNKKTVVVTSDPLALIAEKTNVSRSKEKVVVSSDSKGSEADDFSELKKITALLAKAFNRRKFYSKPTNNNLRTSSTSQSANKKQEFVKSDDKKVKKIADEKKRDMSKVKCYNYKKEGHFAKDCKKTKVKDYEYYKTKMLLAKKDKDEQVLLAKDQALMESSSDSD
nr:hypothetical protein [Tanacetum cinerariifolium]